MLGAIIGDIAGSRFEFSEIGTIDFNFELFNRKCFFTDDTVHTCAIAKSLINNIDYTETIVELSNKYPKAGYGRMILYWLSNNDKKPYNSFGNGAAMRVSPIGWAFNTLEETLSQAKKCTEITHNHPEGIKGAQATASAIFLARNKKNKDEIKEYIEKTYNYDLSSSWNELKSQYRPNVICQETVPASFICFLEGNNFEECIRFAVALGGDTDTQAAISGSIAEAFYGIPVEYKEKAFNYLTNDLKEIVKQFYEKYPV
jgi:ADP-ribosylglycohydrolase